MAVARPGRFALHCAFLALVGSLFISSVALASDGATVGDMNWRAVHFIVTGVVGIYTWVSNTQKADREKVNELEKKVAKLEEKVSNFWTAKELAELSSDLKTSAVSTSALKESVDALAERMRLYEQHMMERGK